MTKIYAQFMVLLLPFLCFSQLQDQVERRHYIQPGEDKKECMTVEYYNEEYQKWEEGVVCRERKWERRNHRGWVWEPSHSDGTWKPIKNSNGDYIHEGRYWRFLWTEWKFE
jgi:hypothetical protein